MLLLLGALFAVQFAEPIHVKEAETPQIFGSEKTSSMLEEDQQSNVLRYVA